MATLSLLLTSALAQGSPRIATEGPSTLTLCWRAEEIFLSAQEPLPAGEGIRVAPEGREIWVWREGQPRRQATNVEVLRDGARIGALAPSFGKMVRDLPQPGAGPDPSALLDPSHYVIRSPDDPDYENAATPTSVSIKRKPDGNRGATPVTRAYLSLPSPLKEGKYYELQLGDEAGSAPLSFTYVRGILAARPGERR